MKEPVLILSDLHLGLPASRIDSVEQLRPLLEGAGTVVFNGDTFQELSREYRRRSEVLLDQLRDLCGQLDIDAVFLPGNHDPAWGGPGWLELGNGRIIATHGDSVMWGGSPWSRESILRSDKVRALWAGNRRADFDPKERIGLARDIAMLLRPAMTPGGRGVLRRVMDAITPPRRALEILRVWISQADKVAMFADRYFPSAEVIIIGHFHWRGSWTRAGRLIVNTGAFVSPHHSMWVSYSDDWLKMGKVDESGSTFSRGETLAVWRLGKPSSRSLP